jgi:CheY-specific phosphatase CheX
MVFTETGIEIESIEDEEQDERDDQFITSVGLLGGIRGIFMLRSNDACASLLLRRMLGDIPVSKEAGNLTEIQMAALGELCNQVAGRASTLLSEIGVEADITPPTIICASAMKSLAPNLRFSFRRVARGPFGRISLFLGFQKSATRKRGMKGEKKG